VLGVAALARFLARFKQTAESARVAACYRALCLSTSDGASADVFSFSLSGAPGSTAEAEAPRAFDGSVWRIGFELFKAKARALGSGANATEDYTEILAYHLSALKGPIMKLGQVLSFYGVPLPEESRELLAALHDDAAPIPFAVVRGVLESELRRRADEVFAELDEAPLSTGSVGQVHRGALRSGERVVVKAQLPGITERVERDFRALRLLLPLASRFFPTWDLRGIVDELRERMVLECDYTHEATAQASFRRRLEDDPEIVVPRVFEALSTPRVLVSELFDGRTFSEFSRAATQAERNCAGEAILRYALRTTVVERSFNTDMHPGNLLFSDGRVCFVDFGNVRAWSDESSVGWREMLLGTIADDPRRVERGLRRLSILHAPEGSFAEVYGQMSKLLFGVLHEPRAVRVSKETLISELLRFLPSKHQLARELRMPPAYAYAFRMYWGMFAILADLGAEVRFRDITLDTLRALRRRFDVRFGRRAPRRHTHALLRISPTPPAPGTMYW
jgi:predicted unusual protein kinase regulating ubiquinone biosynthesis (AarF/ABC1/UbiB family)